jgi:hypothetical protein
MFRAYSSDDEITAYRGLEQDLRSSPIGPDMLLQNLGLFLTRASLARILFMHDLYLKIINVPGCIMEFGCQFGPSLALFTSCRNIYEPQNVGRKIIGFDTFEGYTAPSPQDGALMAEAASRRIGVTGESYEAVLDRILAYHNALGPRAHIRKHELVKGDVTATLPAYFERNPETLIALAYFDLGLYEPTRKCLELIGDRLVKGSIIGLDHLAMHDLPGDSLAVMDVLGYRNCRFVRDPRVPYQSYVIIE